MIPGKQPSPEQIVTAAWRHRWLLIGGLAAGAVAGLIASMVLPKLYRSEAVILVVPQRVPERYINSVVAARIEDRVKTVGQEILGQTWLTRIIEEYDLYPELRRQGRMEEAVSRMRLRDAKINFVRTDAFAVSYISSDPKTAHKVTARLAKDFVEQNVKDRVSTATATNQLLDEALEEKKTQLADSERRLEQYRRMYSGELPSQVNSNQQVLQNLQMQVQAVVDSVTQLRDRRLVNQRELADLASDSEKPVAERATIAGPLPVSAVAISLAEAEKALAELLTRYKPGHPDVSAAKRRVRELEDKYAQEQQIAANRRPDDPTPIATTPADRVRQNRVRQLQNEIETMDRNIAAKQVEEQRLRGVMADMQRRIEAAPTRETELVALTRDYETLKAMYTNLLARREDARLSEKVENGEVGQQFRVIDPPRVPGLPFSPNRTFVMMVGVAGGLALAGLFVAFLEYRDVTLKTEEEVMSCIGLPVIAVIPVMTRPVVQLPASRLRKLLPWTGTAALMAAVLGGLGII